MGKNVAEVIEEIQQDETVTIIKEHKSRTGAWFGIVILLIVICLAVAGYFLLEQLRNKQQNLGGELSKDTLQMHELTKQISGYQAQLVAIQEQLTTLNSEVGNKEVNYTHQLNEAIKAQNERLQTLSAQIQGSITRIQRQLGKTRGDWLVSDAEYLLSVASRRLHLMGDVPTTIEALNAADQRLRESGDTAAFKVRSQIAKDIAAVKKVKVPDIVGIYAKLDTLEDEVSHLKVFLPYSGKKPSSNVNNISKMETSNDVNNVLDKALVEIEGLLTVRRLDHPITSIITPERKVFIQEQMTTKLVIIKLALVQQDDVLYQAAIDDALVWLNDNFNKDALRLSFSNDLNALKKVHIRSSFPDISQSLKMLRNIAKLRLETDKALQVDTQVAQ